MRRRGVLLVAVVALVAGGCSGSPRSATPPSTPTPIGKLDIDTVHLTRAEFCDRVSPTAVRHALDGPVDSDDTWGNGEPVPGTEHPGDVGHELGCSWTGADGTAARAWVFARPVAASFADQIVERAAGPRGCTTSATGVFGDPALRQTCALAGGASRVRRAGLFGDTWVTCELAAPAPTEAKRLDAWCAAVVAALETSP